MSTVVNEYHIILLMHNHINTHSFTDTWCEVWSCHELILRLDLLNAEFLGTLAFPPLNSWGGGFKKIEYFVMSDLSEETSRILAYEQNNNMRRSFALLVYNTKVMSRSHQGHFNVKLTKNIENTLFLSISSLLVV